MKKGVQSGIRFVAALVMGLGTASVQGQEWDDATSSSIPESFFIQGEYFGTYTQSGQRLGAHIRAAGSNFRIHFTSGGLPGAASWPMGGWNYNWNNLVTTVMTFTNGTMNIAGTGVTATLTIPGTVRTAHDSTKVIAGTLGGQAFRLRRVQRTAPTENMPPVAGATTLFDGTEASFTANWQNSGGGSYNAARKTINKGVQTKATFQDCFLHIEFLVPYMPSDENQARGNSGVYLQNRFEQQIQDSFGEQGFAIDNKGALYGSKRALVNAGLPPLVAWETYDIYYTPAKFSGSTKTANARFKTYLNGIKVQDGDAPAPGTGGAAEGPSAGPLFLQNHGGDPVMFKNIWIVTDPQKYPDTNSLGLCTDGTSAWVNRCATVGLNSGLEKQNRSIPNAKGVLMLRNGEARFKNGTNVYNAQGKKVSLEAGRLESVSRQVAESNSPKNN